jgi:hypothetical protein
MGHLEPIAWLVGPEKPLKHLDFEAECGFLGWQNSQGFIRNLAKSLQNMTQNRKDASPDLFGVSLAQVKHLDNFLARCFRTRFERSPGKISLLFKAW